MYVGMVIGIMIGFVVGAVAMFAMLYFAISKGSRELPQRH